MCKEIENRNLLNRHATHIVSSDNYYEVHKLQIQEYMKRISRIKRSRSSPYDYSKQSPF